MSNENNSDTLAISSDYEAIYPVGWEEGNDIFDPNSWTGEPMKEDAPSVETGTLEELLATDASATTTGEEKSDSAEDTTTTTADDTNTDAPSDVPPATKLRFRARFNHEDQDVELDEADLPTIYQKAQYADKARQELDEARATLKKAEALARKMEYKNAAEMLEDADKNFTTSDVESYVAKGLSEEDAKDVVEAKYAKRMADLTEPAPEEDTTVVSRKAEFDADVKSFFDAHPELRSEKVPDEVIQTTLGGAHFNVAYQQYLDKKSAAEKAALQKENRIYKQNAESAAKAPVRGVKGGGNAASKPQSEFERLFLEGFNSSY